MIPFEARHKASVRRPIIGIGQASIALKSAKENANLFSDPGATATADQNALMVAIT